MTYQEAKQIVSTYTLPMTREQMIAFKIALEVVAKYSLRNTNG